MYRKVVRDDMKNFFHGRGARHSCLPDDVHTVSYKYVK